MFVFKGLSNVDMGVFAKGENFLGKAPMKTKVISIDGKNGSEVTELGFDNFVSTLAEVVIMKDNRDEVLSWLSGSGELEFEHKKTRIQFLDGYTVPRFYKPFSVSFIRDPFWYATDDDYSAPALGIIKNVGNVYASPLIKITKRIVGVVEFRINDVQFKYDFKNDSHVIIDCESMNATFDNLQRNLQLEIGFNFPRLEVGDNLIEQLSGDATIEMKRRDRWL